MKAFRQIVQGDDKGDILTLGWASNAAAGNLQLIKGYLDELVKEEDPVKRSNLANKADEAACKLVTCCEMVGILSDEATIISGIFGKTPIEIIDWEPESQDNAGREEED